MLSKILNNPWNQSLEPLIKEGARMQQAKTEKQAKAWSARIDKQVEIYIQETDILYSPFKSSTGSWFNIYKTGDYQEVHQHHSNILSAVYFLKSNPNFSPLLFYSNFTDMQGISKNNNVSMNTMVNYKAIPGRLIVFRSYVPHCVEKHKDTEDRISIAYNFC